MRNAISKALLGSLLVMATGFAQSSHNSWDGWNNPSKLKIKLDYNLFTLPTEGNIDEGNGLGWSGSYWPSEKSGIAHRWNHPYPNDFNYRSPSLNELKNMTQEEINQLSPAEKYDIFSSDYNYSTVSRVWYTTKKSANKDWTGICHGWAMAALNLVEPAPVYVTNKEGITIGFGSSDVKGLLSHYYAYGTDSNTTQIGARCFGKYNPYGDCKGIHPASFHIAITNLIGNHKLGFVADVDRFKEVWNQPVLSYKFEIENSVPLTRKDRRYGIAKKFMIKMLMTYGDELNKYPYDPEGRYEDFHLWEPVTGTKYNERTTKEYKYVLELARDGRILGGYWWSYDRPDFIWLKDQDNVFKGNYSKLFDIYKPIQ